MTVQWELLKKSMDCRLGRSETKMDVIRDRIKRSGQSEKNMGNEKSWWRNK